MIGKLDFPLGLSYHTLQLCWLVSQRVRQHYATFPPIHVMHEDEIVLGGLI